MHIWNYSLKTEIKLWVIILVLVSLVCRRSKFEGFQNFDSVRFKLIGSIITLLYNIQIKIWRDLSRTKHSICGSLSYLIPLFTLRR